MKSLQAGFNCNADSYDKQVKQTVDTFNGFYTTYREYAAVYFRLLYRVFQHIDSSEISENKKAEYAKIVRCQLSDDEMLLINGIPEMGFSGELPNLWPEVLPKN